MMSVVYNVDAEDETLPLRDAMLKKMAGWRSRLHAAGLRDFDGVLRLGAARISTVGCQAETNGWLALFQLRIDGTAYVACLIVYQGGKARVQTTARLANMGGASSSLLPQAS